MLLLLGVSDLHGMKLPWVMRLAPELGGRKRAEARVYNLNFVKRLLQRDIIFERKYAL